MTFPGRRLEPVAQRARARIGKRMPKNPYHRVDALSSGRHIQVLVNGKPLATTHRPALIIETGVPPRWNRFQRPRAWPDS